MKNTVLFSMSLTILTFFSVFKKTALLFHRIILDPLIILFEGNSDHFFHGPRLIN
jgi:hypothetical protein